VTYTNSDLQGKVILFADMRGYTGLAEQLRPAQVVLLLDEFFTILGRITVTFGGYVFHIAGDGMMAGFGVRNPRRTGASAAFAAGDAMLQSFAPLATRWRDEFEVIAGIGVGLHLGDVALGFLGPPGEKAITMIGHTVNVAARLCERAHAGEMLFSFAVAAACAADSYARPLACDRRVKILSGQIPACHCQAETVASADHCP
jgi:class 3 adenylate cyclase